MLDPSNMMSPLQRLPELRARDLDVLDDAEDVGELQAQEAHLLRLRQVEDVRGGGAGEVGWGRENGSAWPRLPGEESTISARRCYRRLVL
jgi:hypothetical protein